MGIRRYLGGGCLGECGGEHGGACQQLAALRALGGRPSAIAMWRIAAHHLPLLLPGPCGWFAASSDGSCWLRVPEVM